MLLVRSYVVFGSLYGKLLRRTVYNLNSLNVASAFRLQTARLWFLLNDPDRTIGTGKPALVPFISRLVIFCYYYHYYYLPIYLPTHLPIY